VQWKASLGLFDDDSPQNAKQEITDIMHYCLHMLQKGKNIMDHVTALHHDKKEMGNYIEKNYPQHE